MREILFRAWVKEFNMMFYPIDSWLNSLEGERRHPDCGNNKPKGSLAYICQEGNPIMQFTGLLDRHGKKIFEGDIVKHGGPIWAPDEVEMFEVKWQRTGWNVTWTDNPIYEVIGSIYENPELLK